MGHRLLAPRGAWRAAACVLVLLTAMACSVQAQAGGNGVWHSTVTLYGYLPEVHGETVFPGGSTGPTFRIRQHTILENLNFAFMGRLAIRKGRWGGFADLFYADLGDRVSGTRRFTVPQIPVPADVTGDFRLDAKTTLLTLAGTYQLHSDPASSVRMLFGARMSDARQRLDWRLSSSLTGPGARSGRSRVSQAQWDAVVGLSGRQRFGQGMHWFVPWYLDVGTGDSRFTGQALVGVGHAFSWGEVLAGWRYIDYRYKSHSLISRTRFSGPAIGVSWRF